MRSFFHATRVLGLLAVAFMALGTLCPCAPAAAGAPCCDFCPPASTGPCCPTGSGVCWTGSGQGVAEDNSGDSNLIAAPVTADFLPPSDLSKPGPAYSHFIDTSVKTHPITPFLAATEHLRI